VVLIAPALPWFSAWAVAKTDSPAMGVALAHTTLNFGVAALFMGPSVWWGRRIDAQRRLADQGSAI
jgi:hypothetical protein